MNKHICAGFPQLQKWTSSNSFQLNVYTISDENVIQYL